MLFRSAANWFGEKVRFSGDEAVGMGLGLPEYATIVVAEARDGDAARRARVIRLLHDYDEARKLGPEKPLGSTRLSDSPEQRRAATDKAALFYIALEDSCGEGPVRQGLRDLVELLKGQEAAYHDLRAALEYTTKKNLEESFRTWLRGAGIPEDFRARYEPAHQTQP